MLTEKAGDRSYFNLRIRLTLLLLAIVHSRILDILLRSGIFILKMNRRCSQIFAFFRYDVVITRRIDKKNKNYIYILETKQVTQIGNV